MPLMKSGRGRGLSSQEVRKVWRYAVATDFQSIDSSTAPDKRILEYGTEDRFLQFSPSIDEAPFTYSVNSAVGLLAIPNQRNIDIYDLDTGERTVLIGHQPKVRVVGFSPTDPNLLVSWAHPLTGYREISILGDNGDIMVWRVDQHQAAQRMRQSRSPIPIDEAAKAGVEAVAARLGDTLRLSSDESTEIQCAFKSILERYDPRTRMPLLSRIDGRIGISTQSPLFSHSGKYLICAPGAGLSGNTGNTFDIRLHRFADRTTTTLTGHRDSITWAGFSPDDRRVASAGWEGDFRVYDIAGKELCRWKTDGQIRGAMFSPDGKYLVTTNGAGMIRVWDIGTGEMMSEYDNGPRGCRPLDWSPNGNYLVVGSDSQGRLRLFTSIEGKIELVQERKLSMDKSDIESLDPSVRHLVGGFFPVQLARFLPSDGGESLPKLVYSVGTDDGVEIFDFETGKGWRFVPPNNENSSAALGKAEDGHGQSTVIGYIWRKDEDEIGIITLDGVRFWRLD